MSPATRPASRRPSAWPRPSTRTGREDLRRRRSRDARPGLEHGLGPRGRRGPRPALGPHRGDLWRGPARLRRDGPGRDPGLPGRDPAAGQGQGLRHPQAHDRPRPARERHQCRPGPDRRAHPARELLPAVRTGGEGAARPLGHAVVQRDRRRALARQPLAADQDPARGVGLQGLGPERLFRDQGADRAPQADRRPGRHGGDGPARRRRCRTAGRRGLRPARSW
jgi:hypothetical protein